MRSLMKAVTLLGIGFCLSSSVFAVPSHAATEKPGVDGMFYTSTKEAFSKESQACIECHIKKTQFVVNDWKRSAHYKFKVGCYECHKSDRSNPAAYEHHGFIISTLVTPKSCAKCHPKIVKEYTASIHAHSGLIAQKAEAKAGGNFAVIVLKALGWKATKRIPHQNTYGESTWKDIVNDPVWIYAGVPKELQSPAPEAGAVVKIFANWGCYSCHGTKISIVKKTKDRVVFDFRTWPMMGAGTINPDGSIGNCAACHPFHSFRLKIVRAGIGACGRCHESEDHPNYEMFGKSMHGAMFLSQFNEWNLDKPILKAGVDYFAPTCDSCHMGAVFKGDKMVYAPTHNPASICKWKLGMWKLVFVRKPGKPHPALPSVKYPTDGLENRKRAFAVCTQCHSKQWAANCFVGGDLSIGFLDNLRRIAFDVEKQLEKEGLATPIDRKIVRNIGAMAVRPTEIAMFHYAPGYIWWDGAFKASTELVEWLEDSVTPRLGADYVSKYVPWIKSYEEKLKAYKETHHIE
ncbi:multiheme c-type cytochrome [Desulfurobacterium sp.]